MPIPVTMPKFGMSMTEGTVTHWLAAEGDHVEKHQPIAEIETDKIVNELVAPASGTLVRISLQEEEVAPVAETMAWILLEGESVEDIPAAQPVASDQAGQGKAMPTADSRSRADSQARRSVASVPADRSPPSSPSARRLAQELGIDISTVSGRGPGGRISKDDVLRASKEAASAAAGAVAGSGVQPLSAMRRAIVEHVTASVAIPQIVLFTHADASKLRAIRERHREVAIDDAIIWSVAQTLREHPYLNSSFEGDGIRLHSEINVGLAVAVEEGLIIPVIRRVAGLTIAQISTERRRLVEQVRSRRIAEQDTTGGSFTITNLGMFPIDRFTALIHPPQAAILSVGRIREQPVVVEGNVVVRPIVEFGLTLDHRVGDGAAGAVFLKDLIRRIETLKLEVD